MRVLPAGATSKHFEKISSMNHIAMDVEHLKVREGPGYDFAVTGHDGDRSGETMEEVGQTDGVADDDFLDAECGAEGDEGVHEGCVCKNGFLELKGQGEPSEGGCGEG